LLAANSVTVWRDSSRRRAPCRRSEIAKERSLSRCALGEDPAGQFDDLDDVARDVQRGVEKVRVLGIDDDVAHVVDAADLSDDLKVEADDVDHVRTHDRDVGEVRVGEIAIPRG